MKKLSYLICVCLLNMSLKAQTPAQQLYKVVKHFSLVQNFKSDVLVNFDIPTINMDKMKGKVFFKAPDRFKVRLSGVAFLPKQNPYALFNFIKDSSQYVAVNNNVETIGGVVCRIMTVLPKSESDLVAARLWIDGLNSILIKSEITTKSSGTVVALYTYQNYKTYALPDNILFTVDVAKFKMPKMVSVDLNNRKKKPQSATDKGKGTITFDFSNYIINKGVTEQELNANN